MVSTAYTHAREACYSLELTRAPVQPSYTPGLFLHNTQYAVGFLPDFLELYMLKGSHDKSVRSVAALAKNEEADGAAEAARQNLR